MENRTFALIVGIASILLTLAMVFAYWWLSSDKEVMQQYTVLSQLPINGLNAESTVKYRGVDVGKVTHIKLSETEKNTIYIEIAVQKKLALSQKTYAELQLQGITGLAYINLNDDAKSTTLLTGNDKIPLNASTLDKLIDAAPGLVARVDTLLENTNQLTISANNLMTTLDQKGLNQTIANIQIATNKISPLLDNANNTLDKLASIASDKNQVQLNNTLQSIQSSADSFIPLSQKMTETSLSLTQTSNDFSQTALQINLLTNSLNNETLPLLNQFTRTATNSLQGADKVVNLLEDNPQSLIFGSPTIQPGPGEAGFTFKP